jgi:hypothetical protein
LIYGQFQEIAGALSNVCPYLAGVSVEKLYTRECEKALKLCQESNHHGISPVGTKIAFANTRKTFLDRGAAMYALIVFTLGWPAPEPVGTFSRIEVCQATKVEMLHELTDISMKCEKVSPLILTESSASAK